MEKGASSLPSKQKIFLFILLLGYFGISIYSIIKVLTKFTKLEDDISDFCGKIKKEVLSQDYKECSDISHNFEMWGIFQGWAAIILFVINLMIFIIIFKSIACGPKCIDNCCTICQNCLPQMIKCFICITNAAFKNPVLIQFCISIICLATTSAMLSASKKGDSFHDQLFQKYNLIGMGGYSLKEINTSLIIVIIFFVLIIASTPIYWILSKCYFNKIGLPDKKVNAGKKAQIILSIKEKLIQK